LILFGYGALDLPLGLVHLGVDSLGREELLVENFSQLLGVLDGLDEDDYLVELQLVQKIHELGDLLFLVEHNVVLSESV